MEGHVGICGRADIYGQEDACTWCIHVSRGRKGLKGQKGMADLGALRREKPGVRVIDREMKRAWVENSGHLVIRFFQDRHPENCQASHKGDRGYHSTRWPAG